MASSVRITRWLSRSDSFLDTILNQIKKDYPDVAWIEDNGMIKAVRLYAVYVTKEFYEDCMARVLEHSRLKPAHKKELGRYGNKKDIPICKEI